MTGHLTRALALGTCSIVIAAAGTLATSTTAIAAEAVAQPTNQGFAVEPLVTEVQFSQAMEEASRLGLIGAEHLGDEGIRVRTVRLGDEVSFDVPADRGERLSAGSDPYGKFVSFNNFDQDAIISGALFGVSAGLCVVSAGVFCVVAGAILTAAGLAISANNGQKCSGGRQLRVYPFSGHKPRCA